VRAKEVDCEVPFDSGAIAEVIVIVKVHAGVVNEDIERFDIPYGILNQRRVSHVQRHWRYTFIGVLQRSAASPCIYSLCTPPKRLIDERPTEASVRAGN
jgi:hypothetical protein